MATPSIITNVKVRGNTISGGTGFYYDKHMSINNSALVSENTLINPTNAATMLEIITQGSCQVVKNKFIRGSSILGNYITVSSTNDQTITDNFFDSSTVDGVTNEALISDANMVVAADRNKNYILTKNFMPLALGTKMSNQTENYGINTMSLFLAASTSTGICSNVGDGGRDFYINFNSILQPSSIIKYISVDITPGGVSSVLTPGIDAVIWSCILTDDGITKYSSTSLDFSTAGGGNTTWQAKKGVATTITITADDLKVSNRNIYFGFRSAKSFAMTGPQITLTSAGSGTLVFSNMKIKYTY